MRTLSDSAIPGLEYKHFRLEQLRPPEIDPTTCSTKVRAETRTESDSSMNQETALQKPSFLS